MSVTALAGATRTLRPQLRYQKKALDARINLKNRIELKLLSSKVMTVCSRRLWVKGVTSRPCTNASERLLVDQALLLALVTLNCRSLSFTNVGLAITYFDPKTARGLSIVGGACGCGLEKRARFALQCFSFSKDSILVSGLL